MRVVADSLKNIAVSETDPNLQMLFARSAFNRYYYDSHFTIRKEVKSLLPGTELKHGSEMGGVIQNSYKLKIIKKIEALKEDNWEEKITRLNALVKILLSSVTDLYDARDLADYKDDAIIKNDGSLISISGFIGKKSINSSLVNAEENLDRIHDCLEKIKIIKQETGLV